MFGSSQLLGSGGASIKSLQRGTIALAGVTSNTATISSVSTTNTDLVCNGNITDDGANFTSVRRVRTALTNATTVTATVGNTPNNETVSYEVVEYQPGFIKSVQRGTLAVTGAASGTATISSVSTSKATVTMIGYECAGNVIDSLHESYLTLTNATTVTNVFNANPGAAVTVGYQVRECYS